MLIKYDNFLCEQEINYISSIICSPRWAWGHKSKATDENSFWILEGLEKDSFFSERLLNKIKEVTGDNFIVDRIYMNGHTSGESGQPHQDTKDKNGRTFLIYCNQDWQPKFGGGTSFLKEDAVLGDVVTIAYTPNSAIYFQNNIFHFASPISRAFNGLRVTLAFKMKVVSVKEI